MNNTPKVGRPPHPDQLTPAEWRVVEGVRHGLSNKDIAARQGVTADAVKYHVSNILAKLSLPDRKALRRWNGVREGSQRAPGEKAPGPVAIAQISRSVTDLAKAREFYENTLGLRHLFTFEPMAFFDCDGVRLLLTTEPGDGNSLIYFSTSDIHSRISELEHSDTQVLSAPHLVFTHPDGTEEWMAFIADHEGQPVGLMEQRPTPADRD